MITKTKAFSSPEFGKIRTAGTRENPLFCVKDLSDALGLKKTSKIGERLHAEDKQIVKTSAHRQGRFDGLLFVTIRGMRDVLINSQKKKGDLIYSWLSRDVVPILTGEPVMEKQPTPKKTANKPIPKPQGVIPFPTQPDVLKSAKTTIFSVEDYLSVIFKLDEMAGDATRRLSGIGVREIQGHLDTLFERVMQSKDAILDVMKDILTMTDTTTAKTVSA